MGRKKRRISTETTSPAEVPVGPAETEAVATSQLTAPAVVSASLVPEEDGNKETTTTAPPASSGYAVTSHSGDLAEEDIYVSDGSDDDDDDHSETEIVLAGSRMGVMRRGLHHPMLVQQNRQWVRSENKDEEAGRGGDEPPATAAELEERRRQQEEEELAKLDPVQRAARLLAEKQRKLEEAKETARRLESEENAGRDPCLFSKRTAFDIRMDQIEDKPWVRGAGDLSDFFNYTLTEDDWHEYSQQQLLIRQELTDASRQRRLPDPAIVPVTPRAPHKQNPKVAVAATSSAKKEDEDGSSIEQASGGPMIGPVLVTREDSTAVGEGGEANLGATTDISLPEVKHAGVGGAWGAGAAPGSVLARLIEEQERKGGAAPPRPPPQPTQQRYPAEHAPPSGRQGWSQDGDASSRFHHQGNNHGSDRDQAGMDVGQGGHNQQWDNRNQGWRHRENDYEGGQYDESRGYAQPSYQPRRGGFRGAPAPPHFSRGRGGFHQRPYPPSSGMPPPPHWAGRGGRGGSYDYNSRKRQREEHDSGDYRRR